MKQKPTILLLDTDKTFLQILKKIVDGKQVHIIGTVSIQEAFSLLKKYEIALILIHGNTQPDHYHAFIHTLQSTLKTRLIPVIVIDSFPYDAYNGTEKAITGAVDFITKPLVPHLLCNKIQLFIDLYNQRKNLEKEIDKRARLEKKLKISMQEARKANSLKSKFLSTMSHEIRTPLNAILGVGEILADTPLTEEQATHVEMLQRAGDKLLALINDILDFSKIEAGELVLESIPFSIETVVQDVISLLSVQAMNKGIELRSVIEHGTPAEIEGDSYRMSQILLNLVGNAIKFTSEGYVEVMVKKKNGTGRSKDSKDAMLYFCVRDTGIGIPPEKIKSVFENFTQVDSSHTRKYGGTGLGLAICKRLIQLMGGTIKVQSAEGKGSCFMFTIPFRIASSRDIFFFGPQNQIPQPTILKSQKYLVDLTGITILIVEHNTIERQLLKNIVLSFNATVREADSINKAKNILVDDAAYDLVIVGCKMPSGSGFTLLAHIEDKDAIARKCIFVLPQQHRKNDIQEIKNNRVASYIVKPIEESKLVHAVARVEGMETRMQKVDEVLDIFTPGTEEKTVHILIAEDSRDNQILVKTFLKKYPYILDFCENGCEAYEKVKAQYQKYDIILMDMQMPVMDGYEATRLIRSFEQQQAYATAPVPIIALSASTIREEVEKAIQAGCTIHVSKPFKKKTLLDTIHAYTS